LDAVLGVKLGLPMPIQAISRAGVAAVVVNLARLTLTPVIRHGRAAAGHRPRSERVRLRKNDEP
jgi:hypothetical protein